MTIHAPKLPSLAPRLALLAACVAIPLATAGCEDQQASGDREIRAKIDQSYLEANSADGSQAKAIPVLSEAAAVPEASPLYRAQAQALLGQASYTAAMESVPELNTADVRIGQLLRQISRLSTRVLESTFGIEAMRGTNPAPQKTTFQQSRDAFVKRVADLESGINEAQKNLEARTAEIKELEGKRLAAANQSTDLTLKSEQAQGQDALNLYNQALESRQQASMLAHQIEVANMDVVRLQQVVEGLKAQHDAASGAVKTAEGQAAKLDQGWAETQKLIDRQVQAMQMMLEESGIASRSAELKKVSEEAETLRKQVNENLSRAIQAYGAADNAAVALDANVRELRGARSEAPEREAWDSLQKTINPFTYDIARSKALFARAHVAMSERSLLDARRGLAQRVVPIFQQAKLEVPAELAATDLDKRIEDLTKQAGEDLKAAEEALTDVIERAGEGAQDLNAARFMRMAVQYAAYHLANNNNALASAQGDLKALMQSSILLPSLPSDLEQGVVTRAAPPPTTGAAAPGAGGDTGEGSAWLKILQRAGRPFTPGTPDDAPGGPTPPTDPNAPTPTPDMPAEPAPGTDEPPAGREPGGNLAPPTGIDF
jgi:hypothetical protein